ncbi:MAG: alpha/beta hydrolase [Methylovirgula sp.]
MAFPEPLDFGADWPEAELAVLLWHGQAHGPNGSAEAMCDLAATIAAPNVHYILPQAENGHWFPNSLMAPVEENEPQLSAALAHYAALIDRVLARGVPLERIVLGGFGEGASLTAEFLVRRPRSYGGAFILTGGLLDSAAIGRRPGSGLLAVPVYVSGSETDLDLPIDRIRGTIRTLQAGGALITSHIFPDRPMLITDGEIAELRRLLEQVKTAAAT